MKKMNANRNKNEGSPIAFCVTSHAITFIMCAIFSSMQLWLFVGLIEIYNLTQSSYSIIIILLIFILSGCMYIKLLPIIKLKFQVHFERKPLGRLEMDEDTSAVF